MAKRGRDEIELSSLTDIEDGALKPNCYRCGAKQVVIMKVGYNEQGDPIRTKNRTAYCSNTKCYRYVDMRGLKTWVKEDLLPANAQPLGASKSGAVLA